MTFLHFVMISQVIDHAFYLSDLRKCESVELNLKNPSLI